ncbi:Cysteine-rich repeat secretory protein 3 [Raphanus sativus]|nr:Cysteine-rich repeat secretory protein 3 [Raphanus sativus]
MSLSISLLFLTSLLLFSDLSVIESATTEYTTLIYKGCAKQQFSDPSGLYSQALSAMFGSLVTQSTKTRFYKTTTGTSQTTITGLFQCRGDLTTTTVTTASAASPFSPTSSAAKP